MFFTRRSLEQATSQEVARYKATRFPASAPVADLCCGIGGDAIALAAGRRSVGVDRDPIMTLLAAANLRAHGLHRFSVRCAKVERTELSEFEAWHFDPDRRVAGKRHSHPQYYEPSVSEFLSRTDRSAHGAVKMAPAAETELDWLREAELEWIGYARECKQLVAWFGDLARDPGRRVATVLATDQKQDAGARRLVSSDDVHVDVAGSVHRYLYEPHPAVLAAGMEETLAAFHDLYRISPHVAYFTSDEPVHDEALAGFRVLDALPYRQSRVKEVLRKHGAGRLEVKKRGVAMDPEVVRRQLFSHGPNPLTLLMFPIGRSTMAAIAERM